MRPGLNLLVSGDASYGDRLLVTTSTCTLTGGLMCCDWLHSVTPGGGAELVAPPISVRVRTAVTGCGGWVECIWIMYTWRRSVEVLRLRWPLVLRILVCCLVVVCFSLAAGLTVVKLSPVSSCQPLCSAGIPHQCSSRLCMVMVYIACGTMASGGAMGNRHEDDRSGVHFRNDLQTSWNAPMSIVDLEPQGVVKLDTSVVPDVMGLKAFYDDAEPVRVLPSRAVKVVRVLVPDARAEPRGFHDISLGDRTTEFGPTVSTADLCELQQLWHPSLLSAMSKRQTWESQHRECKRRFSGLQAGTCSYCETHIVNSMTRHVMTYHLDLGQLWRCPVTWCSHWKRTPPPPPHYCADHIHLGHQVGLSVKASNLGMWIPPWIVVRTAWNAALKPKVAGVATDVMLFSQHGARLVHPTGPWGPTGPPLRPCASSLSLFEERLWPGYPTSRTGPVPRPAP